MKEQLSFFRTSLKKDLRYAFWPTFKIIFVLLLSIIILLSIGVFTTLEVDPTPVQEHDPGEELFRYEFAEDPQQERDP